MLGEYMPVNVVVGTTKDAAEMTREEISVALDGAQPALALMARGDLPVFAST